MAAGANPLLNIQGILVHLCFTYSRVHKEDPKFVDLPLALSSVIEFIYFVKLYSRVIFHPSIVQ